jgi:hypothetical protein
VKSINSPKAGNLCWAWRDVALGNFCLPLALPSPPFFPCSLEGQGSVEIISLSSSSYQRQSLRFADDLSAMEFEGFRLRQDRKSTPMSTPVCAVIGNNGPEALLPSSREKTQISLVGKPLLFD